MIGSAGSLPPVRLREVEADDLATFFEHQIDPEARRMAAFVRAESRDRDAYMARWRSLLVDASITARTIIVDDPSAEHVAGSILSFFRDARLEVSYWIDHRLWGRGVATAALREFLRIVTDRPLHAAAATDNLASIRVLTKCGFRAVGRDRSYAEEREETIDETLFILE